MDCGISTKVHGGEVVDGLNVTKKRFIFHLMATVQLTGSQQFDTLMAIHRTSHDVGVSLAQ